MVCLLENSQTEVGNELAVRINHLPIVLFKVRLNPVHPFGVVASVLRQCCRDEVAEGSTSCSCSKDQRVVRVVVNQRQEDLLRHGCISRRVFQSQRTQHMNLVVSAPSNPHRLL